MGVIISLVLNVFSIFISLILQIFKGHVGAITTMSTDAQGRILYTASADATIKSWNISQAQVLKVRNCDIYPYNTKVYRLTDILNYIYNILSYSTAFSTLLKRGI